MSQANQFVVAETVGRTFRVQLFMHLRMMVLKPFLALPGCAAELAILGWRISLWLLAGRLKLMVARGGIYLWGKGANCGNMSALTVAEDKEGEDAPPQ